MTTKYLSLLLIIVSMNLVACKDLESIEAGIEDDNNSELCTTDCPGGEEIIPEEEEEEEIEEEKPEWFKARHPQDSDSLNKTINDCFNMGARDRQFDIDYLVIAFEGLGSFNQKSSNKLYEQFESNPLMDDHRVPKKSGSGGFMVYYLLWPVLAQAEAKANVMVFKEPSVKTDQKDSKPEMCARSWLAAHPKGKLIITGHSYGGHAANQLADILDKKDIPIDTVITVDARTKRYVGELFKTDNADLWLNFYQKNTLFLNGYVVPGADENINLSKTGIGHGKIPGRPEVQQALLEAILK